ncbi:MAG: hypothetical protein LBO05_08345, partial [Deltaproteobacteria bacterium]|nr:hypothetical protein [Deltaproteobacteria bacterium]
MRGFFPTLALALAFSLASACLGPAAGLAADFNQADLDLQQSGSALVYKERGTGNLVSGNVREYYPSGTLKSEGPVADGLRTGVKKDYDETGTLASATTFVRGLREGWRLEYWPDGTTMVEQQYAGHQQHGFKLEYDERGEFIAVSAYEEGVLLERETDPEFLELFAEHLAGLDAGTSPAPRGGAAAGAPAPSSPPGAPAAASSPAAAPSVDLNAPIAFVVPQLPPAEDPVRPLPVVRKTPPPSVRDLQRLAAEGDAAAEGRLVETHMMHGQEYRALEGVEDAARKGRAFGSGWLALLKYRQAGDEAEKKRAVDALDAVWKQLLSDAGNNDAAAMSVVAEASLLGLRSAPPEPPVPPSSPASILSLLFGGGGSSDDGRSGGGSSGGALSGALEPDAKAAAEWFRKAADQGSSFAKIRLGQLTFVGDGTPTDVEGAMRLFRQADRAGGTIYGLTPLAEKGSARARLFLAREHALRADFGKALQWMRAAAEAGNPEAVFELGYFYDFGVGVGERDAEERNRLLAEAGELGHEDALAMMVLHGADDGDFDLAKNFLNAAKSGGMPADKTR